MPHDTPAIQHVSDTAFMVAHYRAIETRRKDALFEDPYAEALAGEHGKAAAESMQATSRYAQWTLSIRTWLIDRWIEKLAATQEVDTILNLGAGLDSRPYRIEVPKSLRWIEADYTHIIEHKEKVLTQAQPHCQLERVKIDLADREERKSLLAQVAASSRKTLVLTEGVIVYLTESQVTELAQDLHAQSSLALWLTEYMSPLMQHYFKRSGKLKNLRRSPFQFFPGDWLGFFNQRGWSTREIQYLGEMAESLHRPFPMPPFARLFAPFISKKRAQEIRRMSGYLLLQRS